jgi:type IV pilus assembly protein PilA
VSARRQLTRVQRRRRVDHDNQAGFTLVELLVVMIVIGILAAIAIPVFLSQRQNAYDATTKSDIRNLATQIETYGVDSGGDYANATKANLTAAGINFTPSKGDKIYIIQHLSGGFCLAATNPKGTGLPASQTVTFASLASSVIWWYDSAAGGLQPRNAAVTGYSACPTTTGYDPNAINAGTFYDGG